MADSERDLETALAESMRDAGISPYHRGTTAEGLAAAAILTGLAARDYVLVSADSLAEARDEAAYWRRQAIGAEPREATWQEPDHGRGSE